MKDPARCPTCNEPLSSGICWRCDAEAAVRLAQRQLFILVALVTACVVLFLVTRDAAARLNEAKAQTAADWYAGGQRLLGAGDVDEAIEAFQAATRNAPQRLQYSLALADALVAGSRDDQARTLLLRIREEAPDHPQINTQLARLAAAGGDLDEAIRYYQNALYGSWDPGQNETQRMLRIEFIRLLLQHGDRETALSQILVLSKNVPGDEESYVQVGRLFLDADAADSAAETFERALELEPDDGAALAGAGRALFALGDYAAAQRRLQAAVDRGAGLPDAAQQLHVVTLLLDNDPMAARLSSAERQRRLELVLDRAVERLDQCPRTPASPPLASLLTEATELREGLKPGSVRADPNLPEIGVDLIGQIEDLALEACGPGTPLDQAMRLIARRHRSSDS